MPRYQVTEEDRQRIERDFTYHQPLPDQLPRYKEIRDAARGFAVDIMTFCPPSRERSLALTNLDQVVMWANAAIARNEKEGN